MKGVHSRNPDMKGQERIMHLHWCACERPPPLGSGLTEATGEPGRMGWSGLTGRRADG